MKILLVCQRVEWLGERRFRVLFRQFPHGQDLIEAELDSPAVPGERYELLLKGVFPGYLNGTPCVGGMLAFTCREALTAGDAQTEYAGLLPGGPAQDANAR
jgi:hypothetical protein